jgi:hypothetical protein
VSTYQIILLGLGKSFPFKSLPLYSRLVDHFKFVNFDIGSIFSLPCFLRYNYYILLKFYILIPISIAIALVIKAFSCSAIAERNKYYTIVVSVLYFFIPLATSVSLQIYECITIGSDLYMAADLSIVCNGVSYEYYKNWALIGFCLYMLVLPLYSCIIMYNRRNLIANPHVLQKYLNFVKYPSFSNLKLSKYYSSLLPLESLYVRYKPRYWWFDIFNIYTSVFLTSVSSTILSIERHRVIVSITFLIVYHIIESKIEPLKYKLECSLTYCTNLQLLVLYLAMYVRINGTLGAKESYYHMLDIFLVVLQVAVQLIALVYLFIHFREKYFKISESKSVDKNSKQYYDLNRGSFVEKCCLMIIDYDAISKRDLFRVIAVMFYSLSPVGTYSWLRSQIHFKTYYFKRMLSKELFVSAELPNVIVRDQRIGSLTIFADETIS